jgi:aconitate hydratase
VDERMLDEPIPEEDAKQIKPEKGPNIASIPKMDHIPDELEIPILLKMGDNISTDEILAGGARVLPFRSNLPEISKFTFEIIDETYHERGKETVESGGHAVVAGYNYGQGSSREHAALAPRYLGLRVALVKDFARIHWQNLVNFGVLPLTFVKEEDYDLLEQGDVLEIKDVKEKIKNESEFEINVRGKEQKIKVTHALSERQKEIMLKGGIINWVKDRAVKK